jgi:hypothetical protein
MIYVPRNDEEQRGIDNGVSGRNVNGDVPVSTEQERLQGSERYDEKLLSYGQVQGCFQVSVFSGICSTWTLRSLRTQCRIVQRSRRI